MNENPTILLADANESLLTVISYNLERYGFIVNTANSGTVAMNILEHATPNVIVIDDSINNNQSGSLSATEICTILKSKNNTKDIPIILITDDVNKYEKKPVKNQVNEIITKPYATSLLVSKIKSLFAQVKPSTLSRYLEYNGLKMNIGSYKVTQNGKNIHLGPTEFKILQCLMELPSKILTREHIMKHVWGYNSQVEPRTIDVHINRLRAALKNDNYQDNAPTIRTIRSAGYCLSVGD